MDSSLSDFRQEIDAMKRVQDVDFVIKMVEASVDPASFVVPQRLLPVQPTDDQKSLQSSTSSTSSSSLSVSALISSRFSGKSEEGDPVLVLQRSTSVPSSVANKFQDKPSVIPGGPVLVMELAAGGELFDYVQNCSGFSEAIARTYFRQLISAIEGCHARGVVHRDVKLENLLIDGIFSLKLADFGEAEIVPNCNDSTVAALQGRKGTLIYMAPEVLANLKYNHQCDVFSAGVVLFVMLSGSNKNLCILNCKQELL
eukprot:TRINITY_DN16338_c0_g2_i1.p1 TRINITY_DN16338_c0_g2~~TRINITY_DN16338_c0_g2_i1.p1  ORF type:complete len:256 (-),score=69.34 TRINITY_DN16338_c0_g2_i1:932-1699(-)